MRFLFAILCAVFMLGAVACDECDDNDTQCDGDTIQVCSDGEWKDVFDCSSAQTVCSEDCDISYPGYDEICCE
jgi:hypothetical protein